MAHSDDDLKSAARKYCELMGLDPDVLLDMKGRPESSPGFYKEFALPRWQTVLPQIREHWAMRVALTYVPPEENG